MVYSTLAITLLIKIEKVKQTLSQQNYDGSDPTILIAMNQAHVAAKSIYTEAGVTFPTAIGEDDELEELLVELAAAVFKKKVADTLDGKRAFQVEIDDAKKEIMLHIGIVPDRKDEVFSTDPQVAVGARITSLGDSGDED